MLAFFSKHTTKHSARKHSCTLVLLSHISFLKWQRIPCQLNILDVTTLICRRNVSPNVSEAQHSQSTGHLFSSQNVKNMFMCEDGTLLSLCLVCNGKIDCLKGDDESKCHCVQTSRKTEPCNVMKITLQCICRIFYKEKQNRTCILNIFSTQAMGTHVEFHQKQYSCSDREIKCQYSVTESSNSTQTQYCQSGLHLDNCKKHSCEDSHTFKCPLYYCVPWSYVCNGRYDCPWGSDEGDCSAAFRSGFFKCYLSSMDIHLSDVCNGMKDCPHHDDEELCYLKERICPQGCLCFGFVIRCHQLSFHNATTFGVQFKGVFFILRNSHVTFVNSCFINTFQDLVEIDMRYNKIQEATFDLKTRSPHTTLKILLLSVNCISKLHRNFVSVFGYLRIIKVSNNLISDINCWAFDAPHELDVVDLSYNYFTKLTACAFKSLKVRFLNLSHNDIHTIERGEVFGMDIENVLSTSFVLCCSVDYDSCSTAPPWPYSCESMIDGVSLKLVMWIIGIMGVILNTTSIMKCCFYLYRKEEESFSVLLLPVSVSDLVLGCVVVMIVSVDRYYGETYIRQDFLWRSHPVCHIICSLALWSNLFNVESLIIMAVVRFCVIQRPLHSKLASNSLVFKITLSALLSCVLLVAGCIIFALLISPFQQQTRGFCLMIGQEITNLPSTVLTVIFQLIGTVTIPVLYFLLIQNIWSSGKGIRSTHARATLKNKVSTVKVVLAGLTNLLCWLPSSCIYIVTLVVSKYPLQLLLYNLVIAVPINSLLNPIFFNLNLRCLFESKGKSESSGQ